jgi:signal transduction histidine kinase
MLNNNEKLQKDYDLETIDYLEELLQGKLHKPLTKRELLAKEFKDHFILHTHIWPSGNESLSSTGANEAYTKSIEKIQGEDYYWTLLVILERDPLLSPIIKQRNKTLLFGLFIAVIISLSSFFIARGITKPLLELRNSAIKIGKGDLNTKIKVRSKNEIGDLARSFETMRINLKKSRAQLVKKEKLEKANKELAKSNKLKDLFMDIMRHDLLNPAGVVKISSQLALMEEKDVKRKEVLGKIVKNNSRVIKMIENASILAKLESGENIEFKEEDLGILLKGSVEELSERAKEKCMKIKLFAEGKFPAVVNPLIQNVFSNFISNAIKYSPEKTEVIVGIKEKGEDWLVYVEDRGEGIPTKYKGMVFERFTRLEKGAIKGSGLGLAISKKIAEAHNGKVWVRDHKGGGSVFYVLVPKIHKEVETKPANNIVSKEEGIK